MHQADCISPETMSTSENQEEGVQGKRHESSFLFLPGFMSAHLGFSGVCASWASPLSCGLNEDLGPHRVIVGLLGWAVKELETGPQAPCWPDHRADGRCVSPHQCVLENPTRLNVGHKVSRSLTEAWKGLRSWSMPFLSSRNLAGAQAWLFNPSGHRGLQTLAWCISVSL